MSTTAHGEELRLPSQLEAQQALGQQSFFDPRLSRDGRVSFVTCHQPERAFTDGRPVAIGFVGLKGTRNTPSLIDLAAQRSLFWDGRRVSREQRALDPLMNTREHGLSGADEVLSILTADTRYLAAFRRAFGTDDEQSVTASNVASALAAFQCTLSRNSP